MYKLSISQPVCPCFKVRNAHMPSFKRFLLQFQQLHLFIISFSRQEERSYDERESNVRSMNYQEAVEEIRRNITAQQRNDGIMQCTSLTVIARIRPLLENEISRIQSQARSSSVAVGSGRELSRYFAMNQ